MRIWTKVPQAILVVLSRRICAKACVKTRSTACPHSVCPAEKIHVLRRRTSLTLIDFVRRGRRSYLPVYNDMLFPITINAGQALLRVRRRAMDLRAGLDGGGAGNTCCIIKSPPFKDVRKAALYCVPV